MAKKVTPPPVETVKSPAQRLSDFLKAEGITLSHSYRLFIPEKYKNVIHPAIAEAIELQMVEAQITMVVK